MTSESFPYRISDIPRSLLEAVAILIAKYSTSLIRGDRGPNGQAQAQLIGSGTFVRVDDSWGIITAQHVTDLIGFSSRLGLILVEEEHNFWIERQHLRIIHLASEVVAGQGPDLAFVKLPLPKVSEIRAYKSFYPLLSYRAEMLRKPLALDAAPWFVCGTIGERTGEEASTTGFEHLMAFRGQCGVGGASLDYVKDGYDYIDIPVEYKDTEDLPISFGGISGGGAWQVVLQGPSVEQLQPVKYLYSGVPICQSELKDHERIVTCHGRKSIYSSLLTRIEQEFT